jgi:hypothetical protein
MKGVGISIFAMLRNAFLCGNISDIHHRKILSLIDDLRRRADPIHIEVGRLIRK